MKYNEEKERLMKEVLGKNRNFSTAYSDSLDVLKETETELQKIIDRNNRAITELKSNATMSDNDLKSLKKEIEKDFNVKIDAPENIVYGKASKEVFDKINEELKAMVVGQEEATDLMTIAFRRPYVTGANPMKIRNSILLTGNNGSGRHLLVNSMANLLKKNGLTTSNEVFTIDMSRYQSQSQEALFLQDLYVSLQGKNPIVVIENFESSSPVYNRMLAELTITGKCNLNKRYVFANNQLQEATSKLTKESIDHLEGNNKTLVYVSENKPSKIMDYFGKSFIDAIDDKISTVLLDEDALNIIIDKMMASFKQKCTNQLEMNIQIDSSVKDYIKSCFEPNDGVDSILPIINKIYDEIVDLALRNENIVTLTLKYDSQVIAYNDQNEYALELMDDSKYEREAIQKELDEIVGLNTVKEYLLSLENHIKVSKLRKQKGLKTAEVSKHMIFTGNPGTGKTTIARLISRMMKACGILKQGQLVEVTRADLVGKYVGHTAPLTMDVIQSAIGGVLFIDEAYSLYRGKDDSFGLEAIDTIVKAMEDHRDDLIVILAGYSKEMEDFLTANSGLKSRFANIIHFEDYTGEELMLISKSIAKSKDYVIEKEALKPLQDYFTIVQMRKDSTSGNGRLARNLVEDAILRQSKRLLDNPDDAMDVLKLEDFNLNN